MAKLQIICLKIQHNSLCNNAIYLSMPNFARYCAFLRLFTYVCNIYAHFPSHLHFLYIIYVYALFLPWLHFF